MMAPRIADEGDARFIFDAQQGHADVAIVDRDLERDDGLETAVTISLFSNRRADDEDDLPDADGSREGWWGDAFLTNGDKIGSKLWLLGRGKFVDSLEVDAERFSKEALQWMVEDGVASKINVLVERVLDSTTGNSVLKITVEIVGPEGDESVFFPYFFNWKNQVARRAV